MPRTRISFRTEFKCSHRLANPGLSDRENHAIYGKCSNPNGHGHNYKVTVTLEGKIDRATGMLLPRDRMQSRVHELLDEILDFTYLNDTLGQEVIPSGENIVQAAWKRLDGGFVPLKLIRVHLEETRKNSFEYTGD